MTSAKSLPATSRATAPQSTCSRTALAAGVGTAAAMRVATFNILHGRNPADDVVDVATFAQAVADLDADVLAPG